MHVLYMVTTITKLRSLGYCYIRMAVIIIFVYTGCDNFLHQKTRFHKQEGDETPQNSNTLHVRSTLVCVLPEASRSQKMYTACTFNTI